VIPASAPEITPPTIAVGPDAKWSRRFNNQLTDPQTTIPVITDEENINLLKPGAINLLCQAAFADADKTRRLISVQVARKIKTASEVPTKKPVNANAAAAMAINTNKTKSKPTSINGLPISSSSALLTWEAMVEAIADGTVCGVAYFTFARIVVAANVMLNSIHVKTKSFMLKTKKSVHLNSDYLIVNNC